MIDRLPPQNLDAEQATLGSILIDPDALTEIADFLTADDFYLAAHRRIYAAMLALYEARVAVDVVTLADRLGPDLEGVGGAAYLSQLGNDTPTAVHVEQYAHVVERKAIGRRLIGAAGRIAAIGYEDGNDIAESIDRAEAELFAVSTKRVSAWTSLGDLMPAAYEHLTKLHDHAGAIMGVPSGFHDLDLLTGGFDPGDLVIIASRPAVGKTSLALNIAQYAAFHGHAVGMFSLEMSREQLGLRVLAGGAGIDTRDRVDADAFDRAAGVAQDIAGLSLWIDDSPTATPLELRTRARRLAVEHGLGLLIVDYLQLARAKAESREREVAEVSRSLKAIARELHVPLIALCQLNRRSEDRESGEPRLSELRDSGAIEQDADVVIFLWRADREDRPIEDVHVRVAKNRTGPTGGLVLRFDRRRTRFYETSERETV